MLDDAVRQKPSFLDQFKPRSGEAPPTNRPHSKAYEAARPFSQEGLMLEVCFKDGHTRFLDSSGCIDAAYEKGDTILALYPTAVVHIEGRDLGDLASLIKERRAQYVQEQHEGETSIGEAYIDLICLRKPAEWDALMEELKLNGLIKPEGKGH